MKPFKLFFTVLFVFCTVLVADGWESSKLSMKYAVDLFIDAFAHGQFKNFEDILDKNAILTMSRGNSINTYNKVEIIRMLEPIQNVDQNCLVTSSLLESLPGQVTVKVNMKYKNFSRINYISMSQAAKGWRITNISSTFTENN